MAREQVVFVKCSLARAAFPSQCLFRVELSDGGKLAGVAPIHYCYDADRKPLEAEIEAGKENSGLVAGLKIGQGKGDSIRVYLPDGEVYEVSKSIVDPVKGPECVPL